MPEESIESRLRAYLRDEVLAAEDAGELTDSTALVSSGVLDSIATLGLTAFLKDEFGVALAAHEVNVDNLDTIERIAALVRAKT